MRGTLCAGNPKCAGIMSQSTGSFQTLVILWGSLLTSQALFIVVLFMISAPPPNLDPVLLPVGVLVASSAAVASLLVPRVIFNAKVKQLRVEVSEVDDPEGLPGFGKAIKVPKDPMRVIRSLIMPYTTATILGCALAESISIWGFILKFLGAEWVVAAPFFAAGMLLTATHFPSESTCVARAEKALGMTLRRS